ncbi:hypothetical protein HPB48_022647 [Haemaphysalis longicornis]|uniref:Uncharacterized protein n=1 Tax=Haemaphysalis longicornis TaxID=44386 RepID=A0A9J6GSH5_HAELO|nr:hypothetical protein HPB48_022647 [Haemaphysalis longicornis]
MLLAWLTTCTPTTQASCGFATKGTLQVATLLLIMWLWPAKRTLAQSSLLSSDGADLTSVESRELFRAHVAKLVPMCAEEREAVRLATVGQADNGVWLEERRGRITASLFKRAVRCRKPNSLLKEIFQYYSNNVLPKEDPRCYGKEMEPVAIRRYVETEESL